MKKIIIIIVLFFFLGCTRNPGLQMLDEFEDIKVQAKDKEQVCAEKCKTIYFKCGKNVSLNTGFREYSRDNELMKVCLNAFRKCVSGCPDK